MKSMNYRTQDVITWDGLPHPDPRAQRPATVRVAPPFWNRLRQHLRDARDSYGSPAARALWDHWLTPQGVEALLGAGHSISTASTAATGTDAVLGVNVRRPGRRGGDPLPAIAVERLRETLSGSLERPLALSFDSGATQPSRPTLYCVVLSNGATLVLRGRGAAPSDLDVLDVEDCFFTRAAVEACDAALSAEGAAHAAPHRATGDTADAMSFAASASPVMYLSAFPAPVMEPPPPAAPAANAPAPVSDIACHQAVVAELVRRYAVADESCAFVLPERSSAVGADQEGSLTLSGHRRVTFLRPPLWGFSGTEPGCRWAGYRAIESGNPSDEKPSRGGPERRAADGEVDGPRWREPRDRFTNSANFANPAAFGPSAPAFPVSFACLSELSGLLRRPEVRALLAAESVALPSKPATYRAAVALGECRILGEGGESSEGDGAAGLTGPAGRLGQTEETLSPTAATAVGAELLRRLDRWTADADALRDRLQALGGAAAEDLRLGLLESRMEAWAAYLAIDASYSAAVDAADPRADQLSHLVDTLLSRIDDFDAALQHCEPCLAAVEDAQLLCNWRRMLSPPFREAPPWWLDRAC